MYILLVKKPTNESRLASLYEAVNNIDNTKKAVLPQGMTTEQLQEYIQMMIKDAQPRHLRKEGRPSHDISHYKIPMNYFVIESNTVNYNVSAGSIFLDSSTEDNEEEEEEEEEIIIYRTAADNKHHKGRKRVVKPKKKNDSTNFKTQVPIYFKEHDYGTMIALHIFKHGRKTIDEIIDEIKGIDKHLKTILINKMITDGYLKTYQEEEEDEKTGEKRILDTLELVEKEKKEKDEEEEEGKKMLPENKGTSEPANP
jgi:hypothetical protein